jgi:hypothetical protein
MAVYYLKLGHDCYFARIFFRCFVLLCDSTQSELVTTRLNKLQINKNFVLCCYTKIGFCPFVHLLIAWLFMYFHQQCGWWQSASFEASVVITVVGSPCISWQRVECICFVYREQTFTESRTSISHLSTLMRLNAFGFVVNCLRASSRNVTAARSDNLSASSNSVM